MLVARWKKDEGKKEEEEEESQESCRMRGGDLTYKRDPKVAG